MTASSSESFHYSSAGLLRTTSLSDRVLALADAYRKPIFAAIAVMFLLGFNGQWRPEPDSALYLSVGRNIAEGHGYTYHGQPHHLAYPGLPFLWAGLFKVAGGHAVFLAHAAMLMMGLACLALCYRLFLLHAGRPAAVVVTMGLGVSRLFYRYCFELRSDVPFLLGVLAFLCGFEAIFYAGRTAPADEEPATDRRGPSWYDWALLVTGLGLAVVMRPTMWALLAAVVFATGRLLFIGHVRWGLVSVVVMAAVAIGFLKLDPRRAPSDASLGEYEQAVLDVATRGPALLHRVLHENLPALLEPAAGEAIFGLDMGRGLNTVASLVAIGVGASLLWRRVLWGLFYAFTVLMMLAVLPLDRYFLAVLPLTIYAWWRMLVWLDHRLPPAWGRYAFLGLFLLGSGTNFAKICEWIFLQHQRPFLVAYKQARFADCPALGREMTARLPDGAWVVAPDRFERVMTFYSRRNVVKPGEMDAPSTELWALKGMMYVLNPAEPGVRAHLETVAHEVGPELFTVPRNGKAAWSVHPVLPNSGRAKS